MRPIQSFLLAAAVCLLPALGAAAGVTRLTPNPLPLGSVEAFMTVHGTGLIGNPNTIDSIVISIAGPAGEYLMEASSIAYSNEQSEAIEFYVPWQVAVTPGQYSVLLSVKHFDFPATVFNPVTFSVEPEPEFFGPPLLVLPEALVVEADSRSGATVFYEAYALSQPSGQQIRANCNVDSGATYPFGLTVVQCTATDANGSSHDEFNVFVQDTVRPTLTLPADIVTANPVVTYVVTATDAVSGDLIPTCFPASGATFPFGTTEVFCAAEDLQSNPVFGTFRVTVTGGPPVLTVPTGITAEATSGSGAVVNYVTSATNSATIACTHASGSTFPLGTTTVSCTATNPSGSDTETFNVIIVDTTAPALTVPTSVTAEATSASGAVVTYSASATDLVDGSISVVCTPASGSTFPLGGTFVNCVATDARGNAANGGFTVTVRDTTPPQILEISVTPATIWPPDHKMVTATVSVSVFDVVDTTPMAQIVSVTSNQPVQGTGDGDTAPDWNITGPLTVELRAERSGNDDRAYRITVEVTDDSGNLSQRPLEVRVTQASRRRSIR
jgi:hypothetical protein